MNINVPKNIKSPTIIVVGQQDDDKKIEFMAKHMDMLEKKLDQQYKAFIDKTDTAEIIGSLQKSFSQTLDKLVAMNKSALNSVHSQKIDNLRKELDGKLKILAKEKDNGEIFKAFASKLGQIEASISNVRRPVTRIVNNPLSKDILLKSFDNFFTRIQKALETVKPRMYPSPS